MAIKISGTTVIDNNLNFVNFAGVKAGSAGTQPWNTGNKKINISDGIVYRSGSPTQAIPSPDAGAIKIDGILKAGQIIFPLA